MPRYGDLRCSIDASNLDPVTADALRERCPVARIEGIGWALLRHGDVVRALHDTATYSSQVSARRAVPSGMDPPEHTRYRQAVEVPFAPARLRAYEPVCRSLADEVIERWVAQPRADFIDVVARPFAARAQCAFLGWPDEAHERLLRWTVQSHRATARGDRDSHQALALELSDYVLDMLSHRRRAPERRDATSDLLAARVEGRPLSDDELVSVLRNWTVGEVGTIAAATGIVAACLADDAGLQEHLRARPADLPEAIEEILRIHSPLPSNRRRTTRQVEIDGIPIPADETVSVLWASANRDPRVFEEPAAFRWGRDPTSNLLYGEGIHVCPGAPLARLQLLTLTEQLLLRTATLLPGAREPATWPTAGWQRLALRAAGSRG